MAQIDMELLFLLLFAAFIRTVGGQFLIMKPPVTTFCEESFTSLALECHDVSSHPTEQPMWIRWDKNGKEIWKSDGKNNHPDYIEAKPYNSTSTNWLWYLVISSSVLNANDNDSFACIERKAKNGITDTQGRAYTQGQSSAISFLILPKECCGMSSCGSTTPVTRLITSPADESPETNQMSTSSSEKSSAAVGEPTVDVSKCVVSVEQLKNEKDDPSYQNMGIDAADNNEYTTLLWFIAVCVFIATISIVFMAYRVYNMSRMLQIQSFRDRAPTDATEIPMLYPNNNNVH